MPLSIEEAKDEAAIAYFTELIKQFAYSHDNKRPTVEDLQQMIFRDGRFYKKSQIQHYGHLALQGMIKR